MGDKRTLTIATPSAPAEAPWELSLAAYIRQATELPSLAVKPLGLLDHYGAIAVGPETVGFDGEDLPWDKVVRLELRDVVDVVSDAAMEREAEKIRALLPPVPGRKWVVTRAMALLGDIAGTCLSRTRGGDVVSEIVYRGRLGREKTLQAGVFASLVMAGWPEVRRSLTATARLHGVDVVGERPEPEPELEPAPERPELEASDSKLAQRASDLKAGMKRLNVGSRIPDVTSRIPDVTSRIPRLGDRRGREDARPAGPDADEADPVGT